MSKKILTTALLAGISLPALVVNIFSATTVRA